MIVERGVHFMCNVCFRGSCGKANSLACHLDEDRLCELKSLSGITRGLLSVICLEVAACVPVALSPLQCVFHTTTKSRWKMLFAFLFRNNDIIGCAFCLFSIDPFVCTGIH